MLEGWHTAMDERNLAAKVIPLDRGLSPTACVRGGQSSTNVHTTVSTLLLPVIRHPHMCSCWREKADDWVAVKEVNLEYHNWYSNLN